MIYVNLWSKLSSKYKKRFMPQDQVIAFFSSDYRELYKGDIYRVLSLPENYVIEFRYQTRYISDKVLNDLDKLIEKKGIIFFVSGNDPAIEKEKRKLSFYSIREVSVVKISRDYKLQTINFYLKLGSFSDERYHPDTDVNHLPTYKNVSYITTQDMPKKDWIEKVYELESDFKDQLFFNIDKIREGNKTITPKFSDINKSSYYKLKDESSYQIDLSCYDPKAQKVSHSLSVISVKSNSDFLSLHSSNGMNVDAIRKSLTIQVKTSAIERTSTFALTEFQEDGGNYSVFLSWKVSKSRSKPFIFGLFSLFILIAITAIGVIIKEPSNLSIAYIKTNYVIFLIITALGIIGAGGLYYFFNKK